jgi:hypothetical protein
MANRPTELPTPNQSAVIDVNNPAVAAMLKLIQDMITDKVQQDADNLSIQNLYEEAFSVNQPVAPRYLGAQKLHQAVTKTRSRCKPFDFTLNAPNVSDADEMVTVAGMQTVLKRGGWQESFSGKGGVLDNALLFGDGFRLIGRRGEDSSFPIEFIPITNNNLFCSLKSTGFRRGSKPVTKAAAIFSGSWGEFCSLFPEAAKKCGKGRIPRQNYVSLREIDQTWIQRMRGEEDVIEWGYFFDLETRSYILVAGTACTIIEEKYGDEYPYIFTDAEGRKKDYIPISHYICIPASLGFYNHGLGDLLFQGANQYRRLLNLGIGHVEDNTYPHTAINIPAGQEGQFMQMLDMANRMRAAGQKPYLPFTFDPAQGTSQIATAQPILNGGNIQEMMEMLDRIDLEFKRNGIYLDEPESADATATQTIRDENNASAFTKEMMKYNAAEGEFEILVAMDMVKRFVKKGDKTPLNIRIQVPDIDGDPNDVFTVKGYTLGGLKEMLVEHDFFVDLDADSGAIITDTQRLANLEAVAPYVQGTPGFSKVASQVGFLKGLDLSMPQETPNQPATQGQAAPLTPQPQISSQAGQLMPLPQ